MGLTMAKLFTYAEFKTTRWPQRAGLCGDDARLLNLFNEAQRRIIEMPGRWAGTIQHVDLVVNGRYWFCSPPGASTILAANNAENKGRADLTNGWYAFGGIADFQSTQSPTWLNPWSSDPGVVFMSEDGVAPVVVDQPAEPFTVRAYANFADDVGKKTRIYGLLPYENLPVIGDDGAGGYRPGVELLISDMDDPANIDETPTIGVITLIEKERTTGPVDVYVVTKDASGVETETFVQQMESWETNSLRQRWVIRSCPIPCVLKAIVKLGPIPVTRDTDFAVIASIDAMGAAVLSLKRKEERAYDEAATLWKEAIQVLDDATRDMSGDRVSINARGVGMRSRFNGWI
jgi:hypothetical protein